MSATTLPSHLRATEGLSDEQVVRRVLDGETGLFEIIMRRYNRRLFRVTLAILRDASEAEDVVQEAYVRAFEKLYQFEGRASLSTWLTKIAVHEALNRRRRKGRLAETPTMTDHIRETGHSDQAYNPEHSTFVHELREGLENAILSMPEDYRTVFVLRQVEVMSTAETASMLDLTEATVKTRLHRAKHWLQKELTRKFFIPTQAFPFAGERCDRIVQNVLRRIATLKTDR